MLWFAVPRKENTDVPVAAVGWASQMDREKGTLIDLARRILMDNERRILIFQLRSMDGQARDGPRKENTDVPVAVVGWMNQMDVERRIMTSQLWS